MRFYYFQPAKVFSLKLVKIWGIEKSLKHWFYWLFYIPLLTACGFEGYQKRIKDENPFWIIKEQAFQSKKMQGLRYENPAF